MSKTKSKPPEILFEEPPKIYRLRLVKWLVENYPGLSYDQIVAKHNEVSPGKSASKESIVRDLKVLEMREEVYAMIPGDGEDGRRRLWYPEGNNRV